MSYSKKIQTLRTRIEQARQRLNDLIDLDSEDMFSEEVMTVSQILDDLLVEYLREQDKENASS